MYAVPGRFETQLACVDAGFCIPVNPLSCPRSTNPSSHLLRHPRPAWCCVKKSVWSRHAPRPSRPVQHWLELTLHGFRKSRGRAGPGCLELQKKLQRRGADSAGQTCRRDKRALGDTAARSNKFATGATTPCDVCEIPPYQVHEGKTFSDALQCQGLWPPVLPLPPMKPSSSVRSSRFLMKSRLPLPPCCTRLPLLPARPGVLWSRAARPPSAGGG